MIKRMYFDEDDHTFEGGAFILVTVSRDGAAGVLARHDGSETRATFERERDVKAVLLSAMATAEEWADALGLGVLYVVQEPVEV